MSVGFFSGGENNVIEKRMVYHILILVITEEEPTCTMKKIIKEITKKTRTLLLVRTLSVITKNIATTKM